MFSVRITSKWRGAVMSFIAVESTRACSSSTCGNSSACTRRTTSRHRRLVSSTLALSTLVTFERAAPKATRAMRSISAVRVDAQVAGAVGRARLLAEVDAAGELAHDEQVGALDDLAPQRAGVQQRLDGAHRAQVRVQAEGLAQPEQPLLGARRVRVGRVPLRAADGGEQHRVGLAARGQGLVGQRGPVGVDRRAAERVLGEGEVAEAREDLERRGGDLGADPVPWKHGDAHGHGPGSLWFCAADDGRDRRGAQAPRAARGRAGGPARGRAPRRRERAAALRPPGRARAAGDGGRRVERGDGDRAGAGRGDRARLRAHALARRATPTSSTRPPAPCARAASGTSRTRRATRPSARPARSPSSSRGCRATSWPPASRRG